MKKGEKDVDHRRIRAAREIGDQHRRHHRRAIAGTTEAKQTGIRQVVQIMRGDGRLRAALSPPGNRTIDQFGIDFAQGFVSEPQAVHDAGTKLFNDDIGPRH